MGIETLVRLIDQRSIEALFANPGFVAGYKQDGLSLGVKGKGHPPDTIRRIEPKLFHIGVA